MFGLGVTALAQEGVSYANANSIAPIPYYEQLYKQRTWTRVDLAQKQNKGFFTKNKWFTKILIDAVNNDEIQTIYDAEPGLGELEKTMTKEGFLKSLLKSDVDEGPPEPEPLFENDWPYSEGETMEFSGQNYISLKDENLDNEPVDGSEWWEVYGGEEPESFFASDITMIEVMEDVIFDKRRARQYNDIISIKLIVTDQYSVDGSNYYVATFAYKDLEKFFREHPEKAIWYNQYNSAENRNLADAFLLRLFHGQLYKVGNPEDLTIMDLYGEDPETGESSIKRGLIGAEFLKMKMLEREHNLWSY
jgi:gliding motility associated protien GldN